jgi:hypothetical protein
MATETFYLTKTQIEKIDQTKGFWKRQFQAEATKKQKVFDGLFGIVLPVICFFFDPIVFRTNGFGAPLVGQFKPFAYLLSFVSVMALMAFLIWGAKLKWLNGFLSGLFAVGSIISLIVGIALFPFSLAGLVILIGALGFTPLFTAFVYWRNAVRAYKITKPVLGANLLVKSMILTAMFSLITPAIINIKIQKGLETLQNGNPSEIRRTAQRLRFVAPLVDFTKLYQKYDKTGNIEIAEQNQALAESYKMLTGQDIFGSKIGLLESIPSPKRYLKI